MNRFRAWPVGAQSGIPESTRADTRTQRRPTLCLWLPADVDKGDPRMAIAAPRRAADMSGNQFQAGAPAHPVAVAGLSNVVDAAPPVSCCTHPGRRPRRRTRGTSRPS
ncbi:hypothetical protein GCM10022225_39890 [Plantactinospora mayteni]|uniref:Uncharacterized protein n=1 Tax=Plantactinospora mayteni TaxID=566021 RepID=A0ABQ4EWG1_9ACTN|nr:hypothetical protein Pma05_55660 [Plantactinospora mayteni]